ncbi:hypothetical protein ACI65C_004955 [Semiaphis heraclei]
MDGNREASKKAFTLQQALKNGNFILAMVVIQEIFSIAHPLSIYLQKVNVDLASAMETANNLSTLIKEMRSNVESKFHDLFSTAEHLAKEIGENIKIPRVTHFQQHRANYELTSAENYYRVSVFIPFIDHFISQLEIRFTKHKNTLSIIHNFIPNKLIKLSENEIETSTEVMSKQWPVVISSCDNIVNKEVLLWRQRWIAAAEDKLPCTFIDAINCCDELLFPKLLDVKLLDQDKSSNYLKNIYIALKKVVSIVFSPCMKTVEDKPIDFSSQTADCNSKDLDVNKCETLPIYKLQPVDYNSEENLTVNKHENQQIYKLRMENLKQGST